MEKYNIDFSAGEEKLGRNLTEKHQPTLSNLVLAAVKIREVDTPILEYSVAVC